MSNSHPPPEAGYHPIQQEDLPIELDDSDHEDVASERHHLPLRPLVNERIRGISFVFGAAFLLPWNAMITATPYFLSRLEGSMKSSFSSYSSFLFLGTGLLFFGHATVTTNQRNRNRRVYLALAILTSLIFMLTISTFFHTPAPVFLGFVLLNGAAQAGAGAYLQTCFVGLISLFGHTAVQALVSGQAIVAVVVNAIELVSAIVSLWGHGGTHASATRDRTPEETTTFIFFGISTLFLVVTAGAYAWLKTTPEYKATVDSIVVARRVSHDYTMDEREELLAVGHGLDTHDKGRIWRVARANLIYEVSCIYISTITLSIFPPVTTSIQSTNPNFHPLIFSALHFFVFNVADFLGRYVCSIPQFLIWDARKILFMSLARTLFIPLFLMCNIQYSSTPPTTHAIISSDLVFFLLLFALGWSQGYCTSLCMIGAPNLEHNPQLMGRREDVDLAATIASFSIVIGLTLGSVLSFGIRAMHCGCNPFISL